MPVPPTRTLSTLLGLVLLSCSLVACPDDNLPDDDDTQDDDDSQDDDDDATDDDDSSADDDDDDDDSATEPCTEDPWPLDNACTEPGGVLQEGVTQGHAFCEDSEDWMAFHGCAGRVYSVQLSGLGSAADPVVEVYTPDCGSLIVSGEGTNPEDPLQWAAPADGVYHVRVQQSDGSSGSQREYGVLLVGDTAPCSTWARNLNTTNEAGARAAHQSFDGGFLLAGRVGPGADPVPVNDGWLVKLDSTGLVEWDRTFDAGWEQLEDVVPLPDGGSLSVGWTAADSQGTRDGWLLRTDSAGGEIWSRTYGGSGDDRLSSVAWFDGTVFVAGDTTSFGSGGGDGWALALDEDGTILWEAAYGGLLDDSFRGITVGPTGEPALVGTTRSFGSSAGVSDVWVLGLDAQGSILWEKALGGSLDDGGQAITSLSDGSLAVAGFTDSFSNHPTGLRRDAWALGLSSEGSLLWQTVLGDAVADDHAVALAATGNGELRVLASSESYGNLFVADYWLLALDGSDGSILWQRAYRGTSDDIPAGLSVSLDGGSLLVGATRSHAAPVASPEAWVLKLNDEGNNSCSFVLDTNAVAMNSTANVLDGTSTRTATACTTEELSLTSASVSPAAGQQCFEQLP